MKQHGRLLISLLILSSLVFSILGTSCTFLKKLKSSGSGAASTSETKQVPKMTNWKYNSVIKKPVNTTSNSEAATLGDINSQKVHVVVPGDSFDNPAQISLVTPENVPKYDSNKFTPIGAPVDISADVNTRLNKPATIHMKIDNIDKYQDDIQNESIWIAYYNGTNWDYFKPSGYDEAKKELYFDTYHYCFFGYGKIDVEERIAKCIHSESVASYLQSDQIDETLNSAVEKITEHILKEKLGIEDDALSAKIISSLVNDDEYGDLIDKIKAKDVEGFNQDFNAFVGKKIAENLEESMLGEALGTIADKELLEPASQALGYASAGDFAEAGRIIGEQIADKFVFTQVAKGVIEVTQYNIDKWKDAEIEAAYKAYKNGANNKFWGYNVDPNDFDALWVQMRGIATKLQSDAVQAEIQRREEMSMRPATDEELEAVREKAAKELKKQFEQRAKEEGKIAEEEARLSKLVKAYQGNQLFTNLEFGYEDIMPVEARIKSLIKIRDKILRDTERKGWNFSTVSNDREIGLGDLLSLTKAWFSDTTGDAYAKEIKKRFNIDVNKKKTPPAVTQPVCDLAIEPKTLSGETDQKYTFTATTAIEGNLRFDWYMDGKKVKSGTETSITPTFLDATKYAISVILFLDNNEICRADASADIKKKADQPPASLSIKLPPPAPSQPLSQDAYNIFHAVPRNIPSPALYQWYLNGQPVLSGQGEVTAEAPAGFLPVGQCSIRLVVTWFDTHGKQQTKETSAVFYVKGKVTPPAPTPTPTPTPTPPPPPTPPPAQGGWYREGAPKIIKDDAPADKPCYFAQSITASDGSCSGQFSWKEAGCSRESGGCSGTCSGRTTWAAPPNFLQPGTTINLSASATATRQYSCGDIGCSAGMSWYNDNTLLGECSYRDGSKSIPFKVPTGSPGSKLMLGTACGIGFLHAGVDYYYVYK